MLINGEVAKCLWSGQAARSNIQAGTSSQRSASNPVSVQRKTSPSVFAIVSWTATRIVDHGCHGYRSSRKTVPWAFLSLVLQRGPHPPRQILLRQDPDADFP